MDMLKKINKGVGAAATAMIIIGGTPMIVQAMPNKDIPKVEAKAICKDIEKSIKNGKYEVNNLNKNLHSNMNISSQKQGDNKKEEIKVKVLQDKSDSNSMAGGYIEKVEHEIINGKHYLILSLDSIDWMSNITASINGGAEAKAQELEKSAKTIADGKGKEKGKIKFEIKDLNSKILMHMNVKPMGNNRVAFRIVPVNINDSEHNKNKTNNEKTNKDENKVKDNKKETGKEKNLQKGDSKEKQKLNKKSMEDGIYTIGFEAYHLENPEASSMLGNFFDKNVKLEVKNGNKKITMLNTCFADGVLDYRIGSNNIFKESIGMWYGKVNEDGKYPYKTYEMEISELEDDYMACVLAGPMGGVKKDIGDFSKYKKAKIVFNKEYKKGWNGFERDKQVVDYNDNLTKALIELGVDRDGNGVITEGEIASIKEQLDIPVKGIKDISILKNLGSDIKRLYLIGNYIDKLPEGVFDKLTNLEVLYLNGNKIKELPRGIFDKLINLKELQLNQNKIEEIPNGIFDKLVNLKSLVISDNPLKKVDFSTLNNLKKLEYLSVENCNLNEIPKKIFRLNKLKTLNASRNNIIIVPKEIIKLKDLKELNLSSNCIEEIPEEIYTSLPNLQSLQMNDNLLKSIPLDVFYRSPKLRSLDFIMNRLEKVPEVPDEFKGKKSTWAYPQKTYMDMKLSAKDGKITWTQNLSGMDMIVWKMIHPSGKTATTLEEYKKDIEKKEVLELMHKNSCEPTVKTVIQKKNSNGEYVTLKEIISEDKIDIPEIVEDKNMKNGDEYRIVKIASARSYSLDVYVLRDVVYAKAVVGAEKPKEEEKQEKEKQDKEKQEKEKQDKEKKEKEQGKDKEKAIINIEKPAVYEAQVMVDATDKQNEKVVKKYVDMEQKINVEVKDKQAYMTLKLKAQQKDIRAIKVDGDKVKEFEVVGEEVVKVNRLAALNEVVKLKVEESEGSITVRFKIPNEKAKVEITMHNEAENKDETFAIKLKEDTVKEVKDNSSVLEKPNNTSTTSTSHRRSRKHRKHKEDKKDDTIPSEDTNVKEDKNNDVKPNTDAKDNNSSAKKDNKEQKEGNDRENPHSEEPRYKETDQKQDNSKEVKTEGKNQQNKDKKQQSKVTSKTKLSSSKNTENILSKKDANIRGKKLPQTGMPFGSGLLTTIGGAIASIGVVIKRKNRKK